MKKILLTGNIVLLLMVLMAYRSASENKPPANTPDIQLGIDPSLSRKMLEEYRDVIWRSRNINGGQGRDARSVWFSLPKLKAFIREIEEKSAGNCSDSFALGIRIYYAAYPGETQISAKSAWKQYFQDHQLPMEYSNHHTVVMVPTYWNGTDGHNYDFDPRFKLAGFNGQPAGGCRFAGINDVMSVLMSSSPNPVVPRGIIFDTAGKVSKNRGFMLMPDNLDNKRFYSNYELKNTTAKGRGDDANSPFFPPPPGSDFTNGGTLIPPPYPQPQMFTVQNPGGSPAPTAAQRRAMDNKIHVPSSGASYMRWVDNTNDTGWVTKPVTYKEEKLQVRSFQ